MDVFGTLIWLGILINPFLAYQTKHISLYRITLTLFIVFLVTWGYAVAGESVPTLFDTAWSLLFIAYVSLLVLNSYFVSKRFVANMTWFRFGVMGLSGVVISQVWFGLSTDNWEWSSFMNGDVWMMSVTVSLLLLLFVTMKTLDRRIEV